MNRCLKIFFLGLFVGVATRLALAFTPPSINAPTAELLVLAAPNILLDGRSDQLAPGVRIYTPQQTTVVPMALQGYTWQVRYLRDTSGLIKTVWLLNRTRDTAIEPQRNFLFEAEQLPRNDDGNTPYHQLPGYPESP